MSHAIPSVTRHFVRDCSYYCRSCSPPNNRATLSRVAVETPRPGSGDDSDTAEALSRDEPGLAAIYSASIRGRIGLGPYAGNRVLTVGDQVDGDSLDSLQSPRCATVSGDLNDNLAGYKP